MQGKPEGNLHGSGTPQNAVLNGDWEFMASPTSVVAMPHTLQVFCLLVFCLLVYFLINKIHFIYLLIYLIITFLVLFS